MAPCAVHHLDLDTASKKRIDNLVVSNRSFVHDKGEACRILGQDMKIFFFDKFNNRTVFDGDYTVMCSLARDANSSQSETCGSLPVLADSRGGRLVGERLNNREGALFRMIQIVEDSGERSEFLLLRFDVRPAAASESASSSGSEQTQVSEKSMAYEPIFFPFQFTTDQEMIVQLAKLQAQLLPLKEKLVNLNQERQDIQAKIHHVDHFVEKKINEMHDSCLRTSRVTPLSLAADLVRQHRLRLRERKAELEAGVTTRAAVKPRLTQHSQSNRDPQDQEVASSQYGLVVDHGFVNDPRIARIVSWAMSKYMV